MPKVMASEAGDSGPVDLVRRFLSLMEARDLAAAGELTAPDFQMTFPGPKRLSRLDELVTWAATRYRRIAKTYERFDILPTATGAVVYCSGTLSGEWPDGTAFSGIRFIDRFETSGGLITAQEVWNDLAEAKRP